MKKSRRKQRPPLPAPCWSSRLLVRVLPQQVGMFRFLLEGYDNLACFTVLDRHEALLKVFYSPHQERDVLAALHGMGSVIPLDVRAWPQARPVQPTVFLEANTAPTPGASQPDRPCSP